MVPSPRTRNATGREEERMASNGQPRRRCAPTTSQAPANITSPPLTKARSSWGGVLLMLLTPRLNGRFVLRFRPQVSIGRLLFAFEDDENLKVIENRLEFCWPERLSLFMVLYSPAQSEFVAVQG